MSRIIAIYPGRFHPFCPHHHKAYQKVVDKFGSENTYIVSSDVTDRRESPLSFDQKQTTALHQGIPPDHFVKVKKPYSPRELLQDFNPDEDVAVFACGEKDGDRLISSDYFQYYSGEDRLQPFRQKGYVFKIPDVDLKTPEGTRMSGTSVRSYLANADVRQFEQLMGFYDKSVHIAIKRVSEGYSNLAFSLSQDLINDINTVSKVLLKEDLKRERVDYYYNYLSNLVPENFKVERIGTAVTVHIPPYPASLYESPIRRTRSILTEGGAVGSLDHPYDKLDLTFGDLKNIINGALAGKLDFERQPAEKTDGQNIMVTIKDGKVKAARNKTTIKDPMSIGELEDMFEGRGDIKEAFVFALNDLKNALSRIADKKLNAIFENGKRFLNIEIIYPKTKNVVIYGPKAYLQINGLYEYDNKGNVIGTSTKGGTIFHKLIKRVNAHIQDNFEIIPPNAIRMHKDVEFNKYRSYFINNLEKLQTEFNLSDEDEVVLYHQRWWEDFVDKQFPKMDDQVKDILVQRWAYGDKSVKLSKDLFKNPNHYEVAKEFDKRDYKSIAKGNMAKFEDIFLELGTRVLHNIDNFLSATPPQDFIKDIKKRVVQLKKQIKKPEDLKKLTNLLNRINKLGGFNELVPSEGIVFYYKGDMYKLTGLFTPVNQLLGLTRYSR